MTHLRAQWSAVESWSGGTSPLARFGKALVVLLGLVSGAALAGLVAFGCQSNASVTPPPTPTVASFSVGTPSTGVSVGSSFSITVTALDSNGKTVTSYTGTVQFTSSDGSAVLPGKYPFVAADNGSHTFTGVILKTAGSQTITAEDTTTASLTGKGKVTVTDVATQLKVAAPGNSAAGSAFSVTISATDSIGQTVTGYTGTVHFTSLDASAVLPADYTFVAADNGKHTFTNAVTLNTAGSQTITATDTTTSSLTGSATVAVSSAVVSQLKVTAPSSSPSGSAFSVTVSAENSSGQVVGGYTGTIHFTSLDTNAVLPANYTFVAADSGTHTFTNGVTLKTTGSQTITATDTATSTITGNASLTVQPPVLTSIAVTPAGASISVGQTQQYTATGTFSDNSTQTLTSSVTWASSSTGVATINSSGVATGVAAGTTNITAAVGSITSSPTAVTLQVTAAAQSLVPRYLFEMNSDKVISTYAVLPSTGQVRAVTHYDNLSSSPVESFVLNPAVNAIYVVQLNNVSGGNALVTTFALSAGGQLSHAFNDDLGNLDGGAGTIAVDPLGRYLYGTDRADGQISLYTLDAHSGAASFGGTAIKVSPTPQQLAIDPAGTFLYAEDNSGNIFSYQVGTNGTLTTVGTPPATHPITGGPLAVDPQNRYLVAVDNMSQPQLYAYVLNNGTLTLVPGSPFTLSTFGGFVSEIGIDPTGTYLYGVDVANSQLLGIFNNSGVFTPIPGSPFAGPGTLPRQLSVDPSGQYVYVAYDNTQEVWTYSIAGTAAIAPGALTPTSKMRRRTAFSYGQLISAGLNPVTFTPQSFYVANSGTNTIGEFSITPATGALTSLGTPVATGNAPYDVVADPNPSNPYVYAANQQSNSISGYTIGTGGTLTALSGSPFTAGNSPEWLVMDSTGDLLFNVNSGGATLTSFTLNSTGQLSSTTFGGSTDQNPIHVSLDPNDLFAFTVNSPAAVSSGTVDYFGVATGHTAAGHSVPAGNLPRAGVVHPSGQYFYVANNGDNTIFEYTLNASTGAPTKFGLVQVPVTGTPDLSSIVIEPTGNYLYASDQKANLVYIFSINQTTGALTAASTPSIATGNAPYAMTIDISGKYLYVSNLNSGDINVFSINLTNGALTPVGTGTVPAGGTFPRGMTTTGTVQ